MTSLDTDEQPSEVLEPVESSAQPVTESITPNLTEESITEEIHAPQPRRSVRTRTTPAYLKDYACHNVAAKKTSPHVISKQKAQQKGSSSPHPFLSLSVYPSRQLDAAAGASSCFRRSRDQPGHQSLPAAVAEIEWPLESRQPPSPDAAERQQSTQQHKPPLASVVTRSCNRYSEMIFEALSSIKDPNGSDIGAIAGFIEFEIFSLAISSLMQQSKTLLDAAMCAAYRMAEAEINFWSNRLPPSPQEYPILGLKLLRLVQNRIVEFHTELELPSPNAVENPCILGRTTVVVLL
nr:26S proteasome non-ATPase regulatory subunit 8 homolog A-like [Ipomoea batatas]